VGDDAAIRSMIGIATRAIPKRRAWRTRSQIKDIKVDETIIGRRVVFQQ
jgi:hypothetical protein